MGARDWIKDDSDRAHWFCHVRWLYFGPFEHIPKPNCSQQPFVPSSPLTLPLVLGLAVLGWYNWARFNSVFETGFIYQLAGPFLQLYRHVLFSPLYILPNLYDYLLVRPKIIRIFPFLKSGAGIWRQQVSLYFPAQGLLCKQSDGDITQYAVCLVCCYSHGVLVTEKKECGKPGRSRYPYLFNWLTISLAGSFAFGFAPLVMFFWAGAALRRRLYPVFDFT